LDNIVEKDILTKEDLLDVESWLKSNKDSIELSIYNTIYSMYLFCIEAKDNIDKQKKLLALLRQHMGFTPKSEKNSNTVKISSNKEKSLTEKAKEIREKIKSLAEKYKKIRKEIKQNKEAKKKEQKANKNVDKIYDLEEDNQAIIDTMFNNTSNIAISNEEVSVNVDKKFHFPSEVNLRTSIEERTRYEFTMGIKVINIKVETCTDVISGLSVTASTKKLGPKYSNTTYLSIANLVNMVVAFGIPIVRMESILKNQDNNYFSAPNINRQIIYAAKCCSSIYITLAKKLANCKIITGDDTNMLELETQNDIKTDKIFEKLAEEKQIFQKLLEQEALAINEEEIKKIKIEKTENIFSFTEDILGYQFPTANGKSQKTKLNTTVLSGKTNLNDKTSSIVFYRTHLGSMGNLLGNILKYRDKIHNELTIQSDLSSSNNPTYIPNKLKIITAGCASHARRPFKRFEEDDQESCFLMQQYFLELNIVEGEILAKKTCGEKFTNNDIIGYRKEFAKPIWENILIAAQKIKKQWADNFSIAQAG